MDSADAFAAKVGAARATVRMVAVSAAAVRFFVLVICFSS
jgi:hypothetical protein